MNKKGITSAIIVIASMCAHIFGGQAMAQTRTVENRPYTDLRPFHFGIVAGTHLQDLEFVNVGMQTIVNEDGTTSEALITCDQDRWDNGFTVGITGELRLSRSFQFRIAPAMYFGTRHLTFHNFTDEAAGVKEFEKTQTIKSAYISAAMDLIYGSLRFNNHRPYMMIGLNPMINLTGKSDDILKLKRYDLFLEAGIGCDFYLPFFKIRPELKFLYGLSNCLDTEHAKSLRNAALIPYTNSVSSARSKMIVRSFYFE